MPNSAKNRNRTEHDSVEDVLAEKGNVGSILGMATGEEEGYATISGGWEGTDDATSTAPSDMMRPDPADEEMSEDPDASLGRAYGGGMAKSDGGIADIKGTPVEDSRDWEDDPIV